jgi:hypothetical protein
MKVTMTVRNRVVPHVLWPLLGLSLVGMWGCGGQGDRPPLGSVSGTVTLDGQPLVGGQVTFAPETGRPSIGRTDSAGRYELFYVLATKGAKVGKHRVFIGWPPADDDAEPVAKDASRPPLPARYGQQSTLTADVNSGANTFDFALESK